MRPGDMIDGHRLVGLLGRGGAGEVWRAEFEGREVALKLWAEAGTAALRRATFAQEELGRLGGREGSYFPRVERVNLGHQPPYVRMELVEGRTLAKEAEDPNWGLQERIEAAGQVLEALAVVHRRGFVHGDLTPWNVLVTGDGVRLIDVGLGALWDAGHEVEVSGTGEHTMGVATPLYAAPERFHAGFWEGCGPAADVFSFGKVLYKVLTGEDPHAVKPLSRQVRGIEEPWDKFLFQCLEAKPERRFADAEAALGVFRGLPRPGPAAGTGWSVRCAACGEPFETRGVVVGTGLKCPWCGELVRVVRVDDRVGWAQVEAESLEAEVRSGPPPRVTEVGEGASAAGPPQPVISYTERALVVFVLYAVSFWLCIPASSAGFVVWLVAAAMNLSFWASAGSEKHRTGVSPHGYVLLTVMLILFVVLPLGCLGFAVALAPCFGIWVVRFL